MPWNSIWPDGNKSVKANEAPGKQNTTYIKSTMGGDPVGTNTNLVRDHFWGIDGTLDGHHRFIQSVGFTDGLVPADPVLGTGMQGVSYFKLVNADVGRVEGFYKNSSNTYQHIPSFLSGTVVVSATFGNIVAVPKNVYGEIFLYIVSGGDLTACKGFFKSNGTKVDAWTQSQAVTGSTITKYPLLLANGGNSTDLNIKVRFENSSTVNWNYRITYRAL